MTRDAVPVRLAVWVYAQLLRALPPSLYREFGAHMVADFRELARARGGVLAVTGALLRASADVMRRGAREWWIERYVRRASIVSGQRAERVRARDMMTNWMQELRLAARSLMQRPSFTVTVVLTLALGIGGTVAIFAIVDSVLLRPLPYDESEDIVAIRHHAPALNLPDLANSVGTLNMYRDHARSFVAVAGVSRDQRNLAGSGEPARIEIAQVTPALFTVLRVQPEQGRALVDADAQPGAAPVAVLTHRAWSTYFGRSRDVIGRTVMLNDVATEIVGIMPRDYGYPDASTDALLPMPAAPPGTFGNFGMGGVARLKRGVTLDAADAEIKSLQARIPELFPDLTAEFMRNVQWSASVTSLRDFIVDDARAGLWIVLGTVSFLLLVACASVANLFLVRGEARQREISVRIALGAARSRVAASFLYESLLVGVIGGVWGTLAAALALRALVAAGPAQLPRLEEISLNGTVLGIAALLSVAAGILFGALPLLRQTSQPLHGLAGASRGHTGSRERQRVRKVLIVTQMALALVLLIGSALMLRSFQRLRAVDPGFDADGVITLGVSIGDYRSREEVALLVRQLLEDVRALPGVISAGATNALPLDQASRNGGSFDIRSRPRPEDAIPPFAMYIIATEGVHETMRTPLLRGRAFTPQDEREGRVVLVDEVFARTYLGERVLGELISFGGGSDTIWHEVVGVVGNVRSMQLREDPRPLVYMPVTTPLTNARPALMHIVARTDGDPMALVPRLRAAVKRASGSTPLTTARTMRDISDEALAETSFIVMVLAVAAAVAVVLGAIGLYGVIGYVVSQRTKEIGVRIALGAVPRSVRTMVLRQGMVLAVLGTVVGVGGAAFLTRAMDAALFEVDSRDPAVFIGVTAVLLAVSCLAAWLPARRASSISPLEALRSE
jgi:putative ABC transport system permease protein